MKRIFEVGHSPTQEEFDHKFFPYLTKAFFDGTPRDRVKAGVILHLRDVNKDNPENPWRKQSTNYPFVQGVPVEVRNQKSEGCIFQELRNEGWVIYDPDNGAHGSNRANIKNQFA